MFLFVGAAAQEWTAFVVINSLLEYLTGRPFAKLRRLVEIRDDASAQELEFG